jgi:CTP synthase
VQDACVGDKIFSQHNNREIPDAGDIESMPFIEALGQFSYSVGEKTFIFLNIFYLSLFKIHNCNICTPVANYH